MTAPIRTVAVVLGDNDFGNTFRPLLETVRRAMTDRPRLLPEDVAQLVRRGSVFHYLAFQADLPIPEAEVERIGRHLSNARILFDEEAEADFQAKDHNHGAWLLDVGSGQINSY